MSFLCPVQHTSPHCRTLDCTTLSVHCNLSPSPNVSSKLVAVDQTHYSVSENLTLTLTEAAPTPTPNLSVALTLSLPQAQPYPHLEAQDPEMVLFLQMIGADPGLVLLECPP